MVCRVVSLEEISPSERQLTSAASMRLDVGVAGYVSFQVLLPGEALPTVRAKDHGGGIELAIEDKG
jgi:hypothetical protein